MSRPPKRMSFLACLGLFTLVISLSPLASAKEVLIHSCVLSPEEMEISRISGKDGILYDWVQFEGCDYPNPFGAPAVPAKVLRLALPQGYDAAGVKVAVVQRTEIEGSYRLFPVQMPFPCSLPERYTFTPPDASIYNQNAEYPEANARLVGQGSLSGYNIAEVCIHPVKWNPATGTLSLHDIEIILELVPSAEPFKVAKRSPLGERTFRRAVMNLVDNPSDVPDKAALELTSPAAGRGDVVEYLIITKSDLVSSFQPLADWKTKKGYPSEIVTTTWVYANYGIPTDDDATRIRECIKDYWQNKGLVYVLLGGDTATTNPTVPDRRAFVTSADQGSKIPCDLYFADLDGTWDADGDEIYGEYPEDNIDMYSDVYVGRATLDTTNQVDRFVTRVLQYEGESSQPPLQTDYLCTMLFLASQLEVSIDGKVLKNNIDQNVIPPRFDPITKLYQSNGNLTPSAALAEISSGYNYINHSGHGNSDSIQAGNNYIFSSQMKNVTNGPKYSIFYSHSCLSANFVWTIGDCIGERFFNAANGGGFYVGNSRLGWSGIPLYTGLSGQLDKEFFKSIFDAGEQYYHLGQVHAEAKHKRVGAAKLQTYERYCNYEVNLFGDPELPVWTDVPQTLQVTHPSTLPSGPSTFIVDVKTGGGTFAQGARVCISKGSEVYMAKDTDFFGRASFTPSPSTGGAMDVTVWFGDHWVAESQAMVQAEPLTADTYTLSESTGGVVNFSLDAGPSNASRNYLLLGSMSGTTPGIPLPGGHATLPLNWDIMTTMVINLLNTPIFHNFMGVLDGSGQSTAQYNTYGPLPSGLAGSTLYFAFACNKPWDYVSNAVEIDIVP